MQRIFYISNVITEHSFPLLLQKKNIPSILSSFISTAFPKAYNSIVKIKKKHPHTKYSFILLQMISFPPIPLFPFLFFRINFTIYCDLLSQTINFIFQCRNLNRIIKQLHDQNKDNDQIYHINC